MSLGDSAIRHGGQTGKRLPIRKGSFARRPGRPPEGSRYGDAYYYY